ncbi:MAG: FtsH protease activity modulator HflK [unclassified Hahellaceae]|nr:FtsH protease activity modulator HflK [Hahellaceae bacterium]|tara:strand:- start:63234 stop:64403 length:1170 start_codon:yes stop_codon:yes gene_type:complete
MAWNEPGGGNKGGQDPWGSGRRKGNQDGPPELDELFKKGMDKLNSLFGGKKGGGGGSSNQQSSAGGIIVIALIVAAILAAWNSVYRVDEKERAIVLRFGKYLKTEDPGLQFRIPIVDQIYIEDVTAVRTLKKKSHMLTEDENIVDIDLSVQWVVKDLQRFTLNMRSAPTTLDYATDSALRHEVGTTEMDKVLTEGREFLAIEVQDRLQNILDFYGAGIQIQAVNIEAAQPPQQVSGAFEDVQRAKEDEQRVVNRAEAYRNQVVPESRGKAQRIIEEANAYREQVVAMAKGETDRFLQVLEIYETAPAITRERMYIETMEQVMSKSSKILVDQKNGSNIMYLPLDRMLEQSGQRQTQENGRVSANQDPSVITPRRTQNTGRNSALLEGRN